MPGIVISTALRTGPTTTNVNPTATAFFVGVAERGPSGKAQRISSFADYEAIYGGFVSSGYLHQSVKTFFEEGGASCVISRAVADGSAKATKALADSTPATAITLTAAGVGTWANTQLKAQVINAGSTFRVIILLNDVVVYTSSYQSSSADMVDEINNSSVAALYVTAAAGVGTGLPVTAAAAAFSGGLDGTTLDGDNVVTALSSFTPEFGPGCVSAPGFTDATTYAGLISHASGNNRVALLGFAQGTSVSSAVSTVATYIGEDGGEESAAFFYPWVKIPTTGTLTDVIPCEAFVAAKRSSVHNATGAWTPYAGANAVASYVVGLESSISKANIETLSNGYINALRELNGSVRVYGARTISTDEANFKFINARETLNLISYEAENSLEQFLFRPIDGRGGIFVEISAALTAILERIRQAGGLYELVTPTGQNIDYGYSVTVNQSLNPLTQLAEGTIKAKVGARVSAVGETIELEIVKSSLTASLV